MQATETSIGLIFCCVLITGSNIAEIKLISNSDRLYMKYVIVSG